LVSGVLSSEQNVLKYSTVETAYKSALEEAKTGDLVIVFGSFYTVTEILKIGLLTPLEKVS
jgi:dihydrofolate synthase/folylpolyglutamate synthase